MCSSLPFVLTKLFEEEGVEGDKGGEKRQALSAGSLCFAPTDPSAKARGKDSSLSL